ncbi:MAG: DUF4149 domain-containing protein [Nitrospinae bacterium]|nr:DUF4149 domain-containing protein [Nitrospinota bacterium]MBI3813037.1 DUF4149 domain-containing protein [Nitrospinota bacterium]
MSLYLFTVYLHIFAAFIWLGGMLFLAFVLAPVSRNIEPLSLRGSLLKTIGTRFRLVGWICIIVLLITGLLNIFNRGMSHEIFFPSQLFGTEFGKTLAIKLTLVFLMIILSIVHDFFVGPRMTALMQNLKEQNPPSPPFKPPPLSPPSEGGEKGEVKGGMGLEELQKLRWQVSWLARLNTIFAILLIYFAAKLAR